MLTFFGHEHPVPQLFSSFTRRIQHFVHYSDHFVLRGARPLLTVEKLYLGNYKSLNTIVLLLVLS